MEIDPNLADSPASPTSLGKSLAFRLIAVLLSLGVASLLGEIAVRCLDLGPRVGRISSLAFRSSENPILGYEFLPGSVDFGVKINDDGMRDRAYSTDKPKNVYRIACIGDSICAGFKLAQEKTFSNQAGIYAQLPLRG